MGENGKPILTKIQNVMGIKNGKYCSSDVSVVSISGVESPQNESVTYVNCPNRETVTINYGEILMNNNIIDDCVLGGSVILNDLGGYVVNYGQTICPVIIPNVKQIQRCGNIESPISIDVGNNVVTVGNVYSLTFNGVTKPGCYTIIGDDVFSIQDTVSTLQEVPDCISCTPIPTPPSSFTYQVGSYSEIDACNAPTGTTFVYSSSSPIEINTTFLYTNQELTIPYYSFGLVSYKTKSGSFTLGTGFDGMVSELNTCL
jgi:hypothetical protein